MFPLESRGLVVMVVVNYRSGCPSGVRRVGWLFHFLVPYPLAAGTDYGMAVSRKTQQFLVVGASAVFCLGWVWPARQILLVVVSSSFSIGPLWLCAYPSYY